MIQNLSKQFAVSKERQRATVPDNHNSMKIMLNWYIRKQNKGY